MSIEKRFQLVKCDECGREERGETGLNEEGQRVVRVSTLPENINRVNGRDLCANCRWKES